MVDISASPLYYSAIVSKQCILLSQKLHRWIVSALFFCQIRPWTNLIGHIGCKKIDNYYILLTGHCFIQCCIFNTGQECVVGQVQKKGSQTDGTIRTESSEIL